MATTMNAIAQAAGVALDTVYAAVGPKPVLFRLLVETATASLSCCSSCSRCPELGRPAKPAVAGNLRPGGELAGR